MLLKTGNCIYYVENIGSGRGAVRQLMAKKKPDGHDGPLRWFLEPMNVPAPIDVAEHYESMGFDVVYEWTYNAETGREVFAPVSS